MANNEIKFKCPKCEIILTSKVKQCPKCSAKFNWDQAKSQKQVKQRDTTSDILLKNFYLFRTITLLVPLFGVGVCYFNRDYATNIKRIKQEYYRKFKNHTIKCCAGWIAIIIAIVILGLINYNKLKQ